MDAVWVAVNMALCEGVAGPMEDKGTNAVPVWQAKTKMAPVQMTLALMERIETPLSRVSPSE